MGFAENALFKSCGMIFLPPQSSWLLDKLSIDKGIAMASFQQDMDSDRFYNTTDLSLILILMSPLSLKAYWLQTLLEFSLSICVADLAQCWLVYSASLHILLHVCTYLS